MLGYERNGISAVNFPLIGILIISPEASLVLPMAATPAVAPLLAESKQVSAVSGLSELTSTAVRGVAVPPANTRLTEYHDPCRNALPSTVLTPRTPFDASTRKPWHPVCEVQQPDRT